MLIALELSFCHYLHCINCNPHMLTTNNFLKSQSELNRLRREAKHNLVSQSHVGEDGDASLADFRRLMAEKESLREKLKVRLFYLHCLQ